MSVFHGGPQVVYRGLDQLRRDREQQKWLNSNWTEDLSVENEDKMTSRGAGERLHSLCTWPTQENSENLPV